MAADLKIGRLPAELIEQYVDGGVSFPVVLYGGQDETTLVHAAGGLGWVDGRCIGFLNVFRDVSPKSLTLVRWAKRVLKVAKQLGETEVFIYRDEWQPSSEKLVTMLGFEMVGIYVGDTISKEIYACRV